MRVKVKTQARGKAEQKGLEIGGGEIGLAWETARIGGR